MKNIIKVILKVLVILFSIDFLTLISADLIELANSRAQTTTAFYVSLITALLVSIFTALFLLFLWRNIDKIAIAVTGQQDDDELRASKTNKELFTILIRVVGLYIIATTIPYMVWLLINDLLDIKFGHTFSQFAEFYQIMKLVVMPWIYQIAKLIAGIWLYVGANRMSGIADNIWRKVVKPDNPEE
jgi:hypothetical protein